MKHILVIGLLSLSACSMGKSADGASATAAQTTSQFGVQSLSSLGGGKSPQAQGQSSSSPSAPAAKIQLSTFIKTMYSNVLRRPAADSEVAFWSKVLVQGGCVKVGFGIGASLEARQLTADSRGNRAEVVDLYRGLLGRDPESDDVVAAHLAVTNDVNQAQTVMNFVNSPEYLDRCASLVP